jgi:hypothetical protein
MEVIINYQKLQDAFPLEERIERMELISEALKRMYSLEITEGKYYNGVWVNVFKVMDMAKFTIF